MEGNLTLDGEHTIQYTGDVLQKCTLETYIILLINVTSVNPIRNNKTKKNLNKNNKNNVWDQRKSCQSVADV